MMENEYKTAWRLASGHTHQQRKQKTSKKKSPSIKKDVQQDLAVSAGLAIALGALPHMAQNQLKGRVGIALRVTGKLGMRAVPVVGVAMTVYDAYRFFDRLSDA